MIRFIQNCMHYNTIHLIPGRTFKNGCSMGSIVFGAVSAFIIGLTFIAQVYSTQNYYMCMNNQKIISGYTQMKWVNMYNGLTHQTLYICFSLPNVMKGFNSPNTFKQFGVIHDILCHALREGGRGYQLRNRNVTSWMVDHENWSNQHDIICG